MHNTLLLQQFDLLATAPGGVARLRELILTLAVQGKLVPQNPADEPASALLKRIRADKDRLIAEGKIKRDKPLAPVGEDEQPFGLPRGWEWVRLIDLMPEFQNGASSRGDAGGELITVLRLADIKGKRISLANTRQIPIFTSVAEKYRLAEGDILITRVNGSADIVGQFNLCDRSIDAIYCDHFIRMRIDRRWIAPNFLALLGESVLVRASISGLFITTAGQKTINQNHIGTLLLPLPPLPEQARIVARVEELMRVCDALDATDQRQAAHHRQLVQTLLGDLTAASHTPWQRVADHFDTLLDRPSAVDALEQTILQLAVRGQLVPQDPTDEPASALLQRIRAEKDRLIAEGKIKRDKPLAPIEEEEQPFELPPGWEWVRLGLLTSLITSGSRSWKDFYSAEGATFIRSQDIKFDRLEFDDRAFVKLPPRTEGVRTQVQLQDLLITITGANVGKAAIVSMSITEAYVSQHVALVRLHNVNLADFLHLWLVSEHEGRKLLLASSYGAKPGLNLHNINELFVPLPPLPEQARIVARVAQLRRLCADLRQRLTQSQTTQAALAEALVASVLDGLGH